MMSFVGLAAECFSGPAQVGSVNARRCNTTRRLQATNLVCGAPTASIPHICPPLVISLPLPRTENHAFFLARWLFFWMGAFKTPSTSTIGALIVLCAYVRTWHCRPSFLIHRHFQLSYWHLTCRPLGLIFNTLTGHRYNGWMERV